MFRGSSGLAAGFLALVFPLAFGWGPGEPGGMKLGFEGEIFSFDTQTCPGGIFFKIPVHIPLLCTHGYFLRRPNGCKMEGSTIVGGHNYACNPLDGNEDSITQALIPLTNARDPIQHTITFFDEEDSLANLRRFSYLRGLEGEYEGTVGDLNAAGAVVLNSRETPAIPIGSMCYEGRSKTHAAAYYATLSTENTHKKGNTQIFKSKCDANLYPFPWGNAKRFPLTISFSTPRAFAEEVKAVRSKQLGAGLSGYEIWNGLAYCLQERRVELPNGKMRVAGLEPSLSELEPHCGVYQAGDRALQRARIGNGLVRRKRFIKNAISKCIACCWQTWGPNGTATPTMEAGDDDKSNIAGCCNGSM